MKLKVLFVYRVDRNNPSNSGVINKLNGQVKATQELGYNVQYITQSGKQTLLNQEVIHIAGSWIPYQVQQAYWFDTFRKRVLEQAYDIIIIRYGLSTPSFLSFLKEVKHKWPNSKVLIDLPTFPYDKEWRGVSGRFSLRMDHYYRRKLKRYIDYIIHLGAESSIWGVPTIPISNGIDIASIGNVAHVRPAIEQNETLHVIAVGKWQYWHGLDRVIKGIAPEDDIRLHLVGEGPENITLLQLVERLGVKRQVRFYGSLTGSELHKVYDRCHIAIGTLGLHRKGVKIDSSLKHREYCVRGAPFILGSEDLDFPPDLPFVQYFYGEKIIKSEDLKTFYRSCQVEDNIRQKMKDYAVEHLSWYDKMKTILNTVVKYGS